MSRRELFRTVAGGAAVVFAGDRQSRKPLFGFKQYGMKKIPVREAIGHIAKIGYKTLGLTLMPTWDTEPKLLSKADRAEIRRQIGDLGLVLSSVQESLRLAGPGATKEGNLERLRTAAEMAHELSPGPPALIETPVGGRVAAWEGTRREMADELGVWARTLESLGTVLAIEGHVDTAMDRPEKVLWMLDQVQSPWIGNLYDYSHYKIQGLDLGATMRQLASRTVLHHVKDSVGTPEKYRFLLPGDSGEIDYKEYAWIAAEIGYRGPMQAEVSTHVFSQPGYDGVAAAKRCWENLAPYFA